MDTPIIRLIPADARDLAESIQDACYKVDHHASPDAYHYINVFYKDEDGAEQHVRIRISKRVG
jgi:hypothetical protein